MSSDNNESSQDDSEADNHKSNSESNNSVQIYLLDHSVSAQEYSSDTEDLND